MNNFPVPSWRPNIVSTFDWTMKRLCDYLPGKHFTLFENGSCVVWQGAASLSDEECRDILLTVVTNHPDFKVRRHSSGDYLVTFKGGIGGLMSGEILRNNLELFRKDALTKGKLPSEILRSEDNMDVDELELIAGLYVRAQLYRDVENSVIVARV
ncbi:hypothetical protein [Undibacterium sp. Ji49W]|uniref:hypothetical protein n=1 Tax=Undibacterium sp. Ji49W TaxID=3413040 RepID=UPI003BEF6267